MSLFLGEIHYWLYKKIKIQDFLISTIILKLLDEDFDIDTKIGRLPKGSLKEIVDEDNIHGSLQEYIYIVEKRLAYTLEEVFKKGYSYELLELSKTFGINLKKDIEKQRELHYYYEILNSIFLNGMPCDFANQVISDDEDKLIYRTDRKIFIDFYNRIELESLHKDVKVSIANGLFKDIDIKVNNLEEDYFIIRRV